MEKFDKENPYNPNSKKNHSKENQPKSYKPVKIILISLVSLIVLLFVAAFINAITSSPEENKARNERLKEVEKEGIKIYTKGNAQMYSQGYIENYKIPSFASAEYKSDTTGVTKINDTIFTVKSQFNYKNSSGASLKAKYSCKIIFHPKDDTQEIKDVIME